MIIFRTKLLLSCMLNKSAVVKGVFYIYILCLIFIVFFTPNRHLSDNRRVYDMHLIPLQSTINGLYRTPGEHFWPYWTGYFENLIGNIVLFIPMGFLVKGLNGKKGIWQIIAIGALISIAIEVLQLAFKIGVCDIDDVLLNTLGTMCGVWLWKSLRR